MNHYLTQLCLLCPVWLMPSVLNASETDNKQSATKTINPSPIDTGTLVDTLLGLGAILALIFVLAWLIKRTGKFQASGNGEIKILSALPLGTRERAVLLEVSGERVLIGVTTQQINTLHIVGQQERKQEQQDKYAQFDDQLQRILQQEQKND